MALSDVVRVSAGARRFAEGLHDFLHGTGTDAERFTRWCRIVAGLPRRQTRVLTWPVVDRLRIHRGADVPHVSQPDVTRIGAVRYGVELQYSSRRRPVRIYYGLRRPSDATCEPCNRAK